MSKLPVGAGALGGVLLGGAMLEAGKPTSAAGFPYRNDTWDPDAPGILRRAKLEQDQKKQGQDMEASRGAAFKKLDTSSLDDAGSKATEVGEKMKSDLNITAAPKVDASSIYALELPKQEQEARKSEHLRKWLKVPPTSGEIARMDQALLWPTLYLDEPGRRFMNLWAFHLGVENNTKVVCGIFGISRKSVWQRANKLNEVIAEGLHKSETSSPWSV